MTSEFAPRLFVDEVAIARVGNGLLACTLPRQEWTHEGHLAACSWLIAERSDIALERDLPGIIARYNVSLGGVNDDTQGYHETLTQVYIAGVRTHRATEPAGTGLTASVNALLCSPMGARDWPLTLYSRDRLFSVAARRTLVLPDLGQWPGA